MQRCMKVTCSREATVTGSNNGQGETHLCTFHMGREQRVGRFLFVWPNSANGRSFYGHYRALGYRPLSKVARSLCSR